MTKFDPTKPVRTRDGREAEICWTDGGGEFPIGGWFRGCGGNKESSNWVDNGLSLSDGIFRHFDLINIPEKPITIGAWGVVNADGELLSIYMDIEYAEARVGGLKGLHKIHLTGTYTPGEGLDDD